jgi:hypothetical protein
MDNGNKNYEKSKLTVLVDKSKAKRTIIHYIAIFFWIGWTLFYFSIPVLFPILYFYAPTVLTVIVGLMVLSALTTTDHRKQPRVSIILILCKNSIYI